MDRPIRITTEQDVRSQVYKTIEKIKADYADWHLRLAKGGKPNQEMIEDFNKGITAIEGRKYIKIVKYSHRSYHTSVWGFIVKVPDEDFFEGDVLMAKSWNSPARNKARGNILVGDYKPKWDGVDYL